jgi:predicted DNA binding CopG/RHH family protein
MPPKFENLLSKSRADPFQSPFSHPKTEKKQYEVYARYSLNKQRRINIRMTERDLKKIRAKAIEEGIPYQSLISMLIHKYNEGKVTIR